MEDVSPFELAEKERELSNSPRTKVGCCLLLKDGTKIVGKNTVGTFGTTIHAEVSAIARLNPSIKIDAVFLVANASMFTPCGACMDWLLQFASEDCMVFVKNIDLPKAMGRTYQLKDLMPHYPQR